MAFSGQAWEYLKTDCDTHAHTHSPIYMHTMISFGVFDYFVDAAIVRPPMISSIYSSAMPEGHLAKGFFFLPPTLSIYQD